MMGHIVIDVHGIAISNVRHRAGARYGGRGGLEIRNSRAATVGFTRVLQHRVETHKRDSRIPLHLLLDSVL